MAENIQHDDDTAQGPREVPVSDHPPLPDNWRSISDLAKRILEKQGRGK